MHLQPTIDTPEVTYTRDQHRLIIRGRSLPEDAWSFYEPVLDWAKDFIANGQQELTIEFFLEYFNSSSGRYLLELLSTLEKSDKPIQVVWVSEPEDELMVEKGEEFSGLVSIPFVFRTAS